MKISNKADYALHAVIYVASVNGDHAASIDEISEAENIHREYLAKVLKELVDIKLLRSHKGLYGGYFLTKPRKDYTFLEIIEAMEGPIRPSLCIRTDAKIGSHKKGKCPAFSIFDDIRKKIIQDLGSANLDDLQYEKFYPAVKKNTK